MYKRILALTLAIVVIMTGTVSTVFASTPSHTYGSNNSLVRNKSEIDLIVYSQESYLPNNGADYYLARIEEPSAARIDYATVYEIEYKKGSKYYGAWRDGVSGGSDIKEMTITLDKSHDTTYDISFTAAFTGSYPFFYEKVIEGYFGVDLGRSSSYSLGSGASVVVPKGSHYLIKYRPVYYKYEVIVTEYAEAYILGFGMHRYMVRQYTSTVDVFSHWDFTVVED